MRRWERWSFNSAVAGVAVTGFAYFWMKYLLDSADPFAVVNHPWQSAMLHLHVLASPLLVLVFGLILNSHILRKLGATRVVANRKSGLLSLGLFVTMLASGYLLQVVTTDLALRTLVVVHVASSMVFCATYTAHLIVSWRMTRGRVTSPIREVA